MRKRIEVVGDAIRVAIVIDGKEIEYELFVNEYGLTLSTIDDVGEFNTVFEAGYEEHPNF